MGKKALHKRASEVRHTIRKYVLDFFLLQKCSNKKRNAAAIVYNLPSEFYEIRRMTKARKEKLELMCLDSDVKCLQQRLDTLSNVNDIFSEILSRLEPR